MGGQVDVKAMLGVGGGGVGSGEGVRLVGGGVRVDLNAMLGVGGDVGYGGCEPRIEGIVQGTKRYCTLLRKLKNVGGGGGGAIFEPKTLSLYLQKKKKEKVKKKIFLTEPGLEP